MSLRKSGVSDYQRRLNAAATLTLFTGLLAAILGFESLGSSVRPKSSASKAVRGDSLLLRSLLSLEDARLLDLDRRLCLINDLRSRPSSREDNGIFSCDCPLWYPLSWRILE